MDTTYRIENSYIPTEKSTAQADKSIVQADKSIVQVHYSLGFEPEQFRRHQSQGSDKILSRKESIVSEEPKEEVKEIVKEVVEESKESTISISKGPNEIPDDPKLKEYWELTGKAMEDGLRLMELKPENSNN